MNAYNIDNATRDLNPGCRRAFITNVFAHELGHSVGLRDNPIGTIFNESLMRETRDPTEVVGPTPFDIESVNMLYN